VERLERASTADIVLRTLRELARPLAAALGPSVEVVAHDLRHLDSSVVAIEGNLTGRKVGAPVTDLVLQHLQAGRTDDILCYRTRTTSGQHLRSSTIFLRDENGQPIACLCINTDTSEWHVMYDHLSALLARRGLISDIQDNDNSPVAEETSEAFLPSVEDLAVTSVNQAIEDVGVPVELMRKEHRLEVIKRLEASGFFLIQDAVTYAAAALGISRYSIYKYLRDLSDGSSSVGRPGKGRRATARQLPRPGDTAAIT